MNDQAKKGGLTAIGNILSGSLTSFREAKDTEMTSVWRVWKGAVGETIAENAGPAAFKGGILLVHVTSSTWLQHLGFLRGEMIEKINDALGREVVTELKFKIGGLDGRDPLAPPRRTAGR